MFARKDLLCAGFSFLEEGRFRCFAVLEAAAAVVGDEDDADGALFDLEDFLAAIVDASKLSG